MAGYDAYGFDPRLYARGIDPLTRAGGRVRSSHDARLAAIRALEAMRPWGGDQIGQAFDTNYTNAPFVADTRAYWDEIVQNLADLRDGVDEARRLAAEANAEVFQRFPKP